MAPKEKAMDIPRSLPENDSDQCDANNFRGDHSLRRKLYDFVEPNEAPSVRERLEREASVLTFQHSDWARAGLVFEQVVVLVIVSNVAAFALSTEERIMAKFPHLQTVVISIEWITVAFFTVEYILRLITCGVHDQHRGFVGFVTYVFSPFALVDLLSIAPFYFDLVTPRDDFPAVQFIRVLRLLRILVAGEYAGAFRDMSRAIRKNSSLLATSGFAGLAVWTVIGSMYYLAESSNPETVWTFERGTGADFKAHPGNIAWNNTQLFESIPDSMFFSLLNLFGEFPLVSEHSTQGRFVAVFVAIFAVAIFGIPVGILGDGFGDAISDQMETLAVLRRKRAALKASFVCF